MKSFEYAAPKRLKDATALLSEVWGSTEVLAGGTDLVTSLKQGITTPGRVVSLRNIKDLRKLKDTRKGLSIGAMVTLQELAGEKALTERFPSLATAIDGISSDQIRNAGTVGGDLMQRPRCWYFRNGLGLDGSRARTGENRYHAIFATSGTSLFVNASSLAPALIALGAIMHVEGPKGREREIPADSFFQIPKNPDERETVIRPNEILTSVFIPSTTARNATYEIRHRHGLDWPYVTASVAFGMNRGGATRPRIVLGHVAAKPWLAEKASNRMAGNAVNEAVAEECAELAVDGAKPLRDNGYKVQMVKTAVKRAILQAANA